MFTIDYKSHLPIYEQLVESVKVQVHTGVLQTDDPLPSVRQLSGQLGINPNTVQKAYALLEQQGIIYTVPGKGNFISPDTDTLRQQQAQTLKQEFADLTGTSKSTVDDFFAGRRKDISRSTAGRFEDVLIGGDSKWPCALMVDAEE